MNQSLSLCCQIVFTLRQQSGKRQTHKNGFATGGDGEKVVILIIKCKNKRLMTIINK